MQTAIKKTLTWRSLALVGSFVITSVLYGMDLGALETASAFVVVELLTKSGLYYIHEKLWERIINA